MDEEVITEKPKIEDMLNAHFASKWCINDDTKLTGIPIPPVRIPETAAQFLLSTPLERD